MNEFKLMINNKVHEQLNKATLFDIQNLSKTNVAEILDIHVLRDEDENKNLVNVKDKRYDELQCTKDHNMKVQEGPFGKCVSHTCNGCREKIAIKEGKNPQEAFRRCNECDYDLCAKCVSKT